MIASISASGGVFVPAPKTRCYKYFFAMPDMSSETNRLITKASAWMAWSMILQALRQQERRGDEAAAMSGWLNKCGLRQLASNAGCDIKTMRQQVTRLEKVGLIRILRKQPKFAVSPTGQLKRKGRHPRIEIVLNVGLEHMKPQKAKSDRGESPPMSKSNRGESPILNRGESPPYQRNKELNTEQPDENTAGVGVSSAGESAPPIAYPASRITPKPRSAAKANEYPPRRLSAYGEAPPPAVTWNDPRFEQARQRCQDEQAARDAENAKWESERLAQSCK